MLRLTNVERAKTGCRPLSFEPRLAAAARAHSTDMAEQNYMNHDGLDGRAPSRRLLDVGYRFSLMAENIAAGQPTAASVVDAWIHHLGHRENILNCELTQLGVGVARKAGSTYGVYWTQDFGTPL